MIRVRDYCVLIALASVTCGGSPTAPTTHVTPPLPPPPPPPPATDWTVSGVVVAYGSGAPVSGAHLAFPGALGATDADAAGSFHVGSANGARPFHATITANGYLTREVYIDAIVGARDVRIDLNQNRHPFDLSFYRQLARDDYESLTLDEITRWDDICSCVPGSLVAHEVGHAMGFHHVNDESAVMNPTFPGGRCPAARLSDRELYHAKLGVHPGAGQP